MSTIRAKLREVVERMQAERAYIPDHKVRRVFPPPPPPPVEVNSYRTALASIADRQFCLSVKYSEQQLRADRLGANEKIAEFERIFVRRMRALDVPMFCHCMWRSADDQDAAYVRGVSDARAGESPHNYGMAVDVIHGRKAWELSPAAWLVIGHVGKETAVRAGIKITWGGDWRRKPSDLVGWDPAHWELSDWRSLKEAQ